jgi:RNA-directed DNA polymerase
MPPVGVKVSLNTEMQKFLPEKTVTPIPGQNPRMTADSAQVSAASMMWTNAEPDTLMERVLAPANLRRAYQRVVSNKGAPGADGMTVDELAGYVKQYWPILKARLLAGEYHPQGVRAVEIPKPKGGTRQLGIPSVVDRLIQQALLQQLTPIFDPQKRSSSHRNSPCPRGSGSPLSPLLSNILLNQLDRELERRGHRFVRYADDANIYVRSRRAGERVMAGVGRFLSQRLKLALNREKIAWHVLGSVITWVTG